MSNWDRCVQLEFLVHLSYDREKIRMPSPFLQGITDIHIALGVDFVMNDMMHNVNCRVLRRKSIRNTDFDEKRSSRARKDERNTKVFLILSLCNNRDVLVVAIELRYLILANLCMGTLNLLLLSLWLHIHLLTRSSNRVLFSVLLLHLLHLSLRLIVLRLSMVLLWILLELHGLYHLLLSIRTSNILWVDSLREMSHWTNLLLWHVAHLWSWLIALHLV